MHFLQTLTLKGDSHVPPPIWMMRQAGRYLPEYRQIRQKFPDFMTFCFTAEAVTAVTLQPLQRFPALDAAIIFSDILIIPHLLGQRVWFDQGPQLEKTPLESLLPRNISPTDLDPLGTAIRTVRRELSKDKALIGFAGGPWTILTYMISYGKTLDPEVPLNFARTQGDLFHALLDKITACVIEVLDCQIQSGVDAVQFFESWAAMVPKPLRHDYLYTPLRRIVSEINARHPNTPLIYYGKNISDDYTLVADLPLAFGVDQHSSMADVSAQLPHHCLQGNLDPLILCQGGPALDAAIHQILTTMTKKQFVFNLGHGILKDTPIHNVERMLFLVKQHA